MGRSRNDGEYGFARLEGAIEGLVDSHERLRQDNEHLRKQLDASEARVRQLDQRFLEQNQARVDAVKRLDDVLARLDFVDSQMERAEREAPSDPTSA